MIRITLLASIIGIVSVAAHAQTPDTVFLEELTWTEVRDAIAAGTTTIIVPTAGTEQSGPHLVIGKHKYRMNAAAERIARALGNALVAPVMMYVPEGEIDPPSGHMRYPGTISIPHDVFKAVLENAARSLRVNGFTDILLIGDSGPNQRGMQEVSEMLNNEWADDEYRVWFISDYYSSIGGFRQSLIDEGVTDENAAGNHAGLVDTATLLAVAPQHVRLDRMSVGRGMDIDGMTGDATKATVEIGRQGVDRTFDAAMTQIRALMAKK